MARLGMCRTCRRPVSEEAAACPSCGQPDPFVDLWPDVADAVRQRRTIEAVKRVRELTGWGLVEAREHVKHLQRAWERGER